MNYLTFGFGLACSIGLHVGLTALIVMTSPGMRLSTSESNTIFVSVVAYAPESVERDTGNPAKQSQQPVKRSGKLVKQSKLKPVEGAPVPVAHSLSYQGEPATIGDPANSVLDAQALGIRIEYPEYARRRGQAGTTICSARFDSAGHVLHAEVLQSSGFSILDSAALRALQRADVHFSSPSSLQEQSKLVSFSFRLIE